MTTQKNIPPRDAEGIEIHRILTAWRVNSARMLIFIPFQIFQKEEDF